MNKQELQAQAQGMVFFAMNAPMHLCIGDAISIASEQLGISQHQILSLLTNGWTQGMQRQIQLSKERGQSIGTYGIRGAIM